MMELNLLGKTELWIKNIRLEEVDLSEVSAAVAGVLGIPREEILVTDAGDEHIVLDILRDTVDAGNIFGKKKELIEKLSEIPGIHVSNITEIHSEGVLGFIELEKEEAEEVLSRTREIVDSVLTKISKRCIVFSTGEEVLKGTVMDTNSPYIKERLEREGFRVDIGPTLPDDVDSIMGALLDALDGGYGLIITTGGVGAEAKDKTVEALERIDPAAATPYIMKFQKGLGRHAKEGVRIGVAEVGPSMIISIPGPHDEVRMCMEIIVEGLKSNINKEEMARRIASTLKGKYTHDRPSHEKWKGHG